MKNRKWITYVLIGLLVMTVGLGLLLSQAMPQTRSATEEEIKAYTVYVTDWKAVPEAKPNMSVKEIILSMCTPDAERSDEKTAAYTSDQLKQYLYRYASGLEIGLQDEDLYVGYVDADGRYALFVYDDEGLYRFGVHDPDTASMYFESNGDAQIITNVNQNPAVQ